MTTQEQWSGTGEWVEKPDLRRFKGELEERNQR